MNENVMAIISQSVSTTVMNLLLFLFYRRIYEPKFQNKTVYIFTFIATTALFITINQISNFLSAPLINTIYSFVYFNLASVVLFKCKLKKTFMYNSLYFLFLVFIDVLSVAFWSVIKGENFQSILSNAQYLIISCITNILIMVLMWLIFISVLSKSELTIIKRNQIVLLGAFTAFAAFVEYNFAVRINNSKDGIIAICVLLGFLFLSIFLVYFTGEIIKAYNAKYESELMQVQSKIQFEHYAEINQKYEESRRVIHDIKKHLSVLESLNAIESNKKAGEYREIIENEVDSLFSGFQCSNQILSIIMSQKIMVAESEDIKVNTEVEDIMFNFISDIDITAIFANLWDNAIEACRKVELSERFINIIIGRVNDFVVINFENVFDGVINEHDGKLLSTKEQHEGVGMSIIKSSVEKYKGTLVIDHDENIFKAKALIPLA